MSLSHQAYTRLKHKIVALELPPGSVIIEANLLEELGLGRTPVREALQRLEREQLVVIIPRRGMFVADIELDDLPRLYELRVALERLAVELAAQRGQPAQWAAMQAVLAEATAVRGDHAALIDIDHRCHELIYAAADNRFLAEALAVAYTHSLRLWHYALPQVENLWGAVMEHQALLEALHRGQGAAAAAQMEAHIRAFQANIERAIRTRQAGEAGQV